MDEKKSIEICIYKKTDTTTRTNVNSEIENSKDKNQEKIYFNMQSGDSIALIGANGSGKTRFAVSIEDLNYKYEKFPITRITAQKVLSILNDQIIIKSLDVLSNSLFIGSHQPPEFLYKNIEHIKELRNSWKYQSNPATIEINDYTNLLSYFFTIVIKELHENNDKGIEHKNDKTYNHQPVETLAIKAQKIWKSLIEKKSLDFSKNAVEVKYDGITYDGKEMSDGERVLLYYILQVLVQRENTLIIIDEPEVHVHKSILTKLWNTLEQARPDCYFLYITHDLYFIQNRGINKIIWMKEYYGGNSWNYEFIGDWSECSLGTNMYIDIKNTYTNLPDELIYQILGTKEKIIFIEGDTTSLDMQLFSAIFKDEDFVLIPFNTCESIIALLKNIKDFKKTFNKELYGIIDRDKRTDVEINNLEKDNIFCLKVSEVENLFIVPEVLKLMAHLLGCEKEEIVVNNIENHIRKQYTQNIDIYKKDAIEKEIKHKLSLFNIKENSKKNTDLTSNNIDDMVNSFVKNQLEELKDIIDNINKTYDKASSIDEILKLCNDKSLVEQIGNYFGLKNNAYKEKVITFIKNENKGLKDAIRKYIPEFPKQ